MEEAFTSEHWIVRIFKIKKRPNFETSKLTQKKLKKSKRKSSSSSSSSSNNNNDDRDSIPPMDEGKYIGCFGSESSFIDKIYGGGSTGANYNLALHHAKTANKRYFAVARGGPDGHSFAFSQLDVSHGAGQLQGSTN